MRTMPTRDYSMRLAGILLLATATLSQAQQLQGGGQGGGSGIGGGGGAGGLGGGAGGGGGASGGQAFQGGQALQGGLGALGQSGGSTQGLAGQALTPNSSGGTRAGSTSFMGAYYVNPLSYGLPTAAGSAGGSGAMGRGTASFGTPLYGNVSGGGGVTGSSGTATGTFGQGRTGTTGGGQIGSAGGRATTQGRSTTGGIGGATGRGGVTGSTNFGGTGGGFQGGGIGGMSGSMNSMGSRAIAFNTVVPYRLPTRVQVRADVQDVLARTTALASREGIQAMGEGEAVVLRGIVGSERERALAEAVARLTPGVFLIRNELEVKGPAPE